ncbi:hypothetical protein D3C72_1089980 [compost metagenome]
MQGIDRITWKRVEKTILQHGARSAAPFFRRLKNQDGGTVEIARLRQVLGCPNQHRGMTIVPASVHQARLGRLMTKVVVFGHGQGIHVGAQADHAPAVAAPAADHTHNTGLADAAMHFDPQRLQRARNDAGRTDLFKTELGVSM